MEFKLYTILTTPWKVPQISSSVAFRIYKTLSKSVQSGTKSPILSKYLHCLKLNTQSYLLIWVIQGHITSCHLRIIWNVCGTKSPILSMVHEQLNNYVIKCVQMTEIYALIHFKWSWDDNLLLQFRPFSWLRYQCFLHNPPFLQVPHVLQCLFVVKNIKGTTRFHILYIDGCILWRRSQYKMSLWGELWGIWTPKRMRRK